MTHRGCNVELLEWLAGTVRGPRISSQYLDQAEAPSSSRSCVPLLFSKGKGLQNLVSFNFSRHRGGVFPESCELPSSSWSQCFSWEVSALKQWLSSQTVCLACLILLFQLSVPHKLDTAMVLRACDPSFQDVRRIVLDTQRFPRLHNPLQASLGYIRFCSKKLTQRKQKGTLLNIK